MLRVRHSTPQTGNSKADCRCYRNYISLQRPRVHVLFSFFTSSPTPRYDTNTILLDMDPR